MIYLVAPGNSEEAAIIVCSALERSCGYGQIQRISINQWINLQQTSVKMISVFVSPLDAWGGEIIKSLKNPGNKTLLFGYLSDGLIKHFGASAGPITEEQIEAAQCAAAPTYDQANSSLKIQYNDIDGIPKSPMASRACLRYDFTDEWNNLGFGAVRVDQSIWALSQSVTLPRANTLADLAIGEQVVGAYAGAWYKDSYVAGVALWFNRPVGPVDSQEWRVIEQFLSATGYPESASQPVLSEIPYGYEAAVTMRLDCDEDVESARDLWLAYIVMGVPFSLALHAKVLEDPKHHVLPREVLAKGGALLSHTATHAPDWGGSYEAAYNEGRISRDVIEAATGYRVRYAVSPFHQTPVYARAGLADASYDGCIGGIIRNDFDFLMARSGSAPWGSKGFVGHSQQCMLHGDCMLADGDPLKIFKESFELGKASKTFFGYLDHPFSERYQYGWQSEVQRVHMHQLFIEYIRDQGNVLFVHENDAMDFLLDRAAIQISCTDNGFSFKPPVLSKSDYKQSVEYGGKTFMLNDSGVEL